MMHEFQVTFLVNDVNASVHVAQPLSRVARKFKSTLHIINITRNRSAELTKSLAVLQVGLQEGDLCQITAIGIDAELACFVIKDMLSAHYTVVGSKINYEFACSPNACHKYARRVRSNGTMPKPTLNSPNLSV